MRRPSILVVCSALAPAAAFFGACINNNGSAPPVDGGGLDLDVATIPISTADGAVNVNATVSDTGAPEPDTGAPEDAALDAGFPATNLASTPIDFGLVGCGAVPAAKTLTFTNTGTAPLTYSIALASGTYFALQGATSGTVAPGAEASVSLAPPALPITSNAGSPITDTLNVTTNIPGFTSFSVPVSVTPQGGSLLVSPAPVAFGQVLVGDRSTLPVTITNVGNAPVGITVGAPANGDFGFAYTGGDAGLEGGVSVAPDASLPGATAAFKPTVGVLESTNAAITTTGAMCASAASQVAMNGTGTFAAVTVAPGTLPFGTTTCGSPAAPFQTVTITNAYDYVVPYTSALAVGTAYTLTNASGNVPAGGHATITVTPKAIAAPASVAPGAFDDTLTVTPTAPGTTATPVALTQSASGAILVISMGTTNFANVQANQTGTLPFTVTNSGNLNAPLTLGTTGSGYDASFTTAASAAANGGTAKGNATFSPEVLGVTSGTLKVTTTSAQCGTPPAAVALTANGQGPVAGVPSGTVDFAVTCGGGAAASQNVTISNTTGTAALTFSNVKSTKGLFTIVSVPASIAAGTSGSIVIAAKAAVIGSMLGGQAYADTLTFSTNELGTPSYTVNVSVAVSGANLAFVNGAGAPFSGIFDFTTCSPDVPFGVTNTGNLPATVTCPTQSGSASRMEDGTFVNGVVVAAAGGTQSDTMHGFSNTISSCTGTDVYVFTEAPTDAVCQPLAEVSGTQELQVQYDYGAIGAGVCMAGACC